MASVIGGAEIDNHPSAPISPSAPIRIHGHIRSPWGLYSIIRRSRCNNVDLSRVQMDQERNAMLSESESEIHLIFYHHVLDSSSTSQRMCTASAAEQETVPGNRVTQSRNVVCEKTENSIPINQARKDFTFHFAKIAYSFNASSFSVFGE